MKTIADIKRAFTLGSKWVTIYHKEFAGRSQDEHGKEVILYKDKDLGTREISIVQTTQVAFKTVRADGTVKDSWIGFPKVKEVIFNADSFTVLDHDGTPVLTYSPAKEPKLNQYGHAFGCHTPELTAQTHAELSASFPDLEWNDESWHNDACDSLTITLKNGNELRVWIPEIEEGLPDYCVTVSDDIDQIEGLEFRVKTLPEAIEKIKTLI